MPKAFFTPATRSELVTARAFATARRIENTKTESQFEVGECVATCRYWIKGGDFVSQQILGCHNAIRVGRLRCKQKKIALDRVARTKSVVGLIGPDDDVEELVRALSEQFPGESSQKTRRSRRDNETLEFAGPAPDVLAN